MHDEALQYVVGGKLNNECSTLLFSPFSSFVSQNRESTAEPQDDFSCFILDRENSSLNEQKVIDAVSTFVGIQKTVSFLHNLIPAWLTNKKKSQELYIDEKGAGEFLTEIVKEILCAFVGEPGLKLTSVERDLEICFVHFGVQFLCQHGGEDSMRLVFRCLTSYCFLEETICSGRFGIYHLLKDIERAVNQRVIICLLNLFIPLNAAFVLSLHWSKTLEFFIY